MTTFDELPTMPEHLEDVSAESLLKALAVRTYAAAYSAEKLEIEDREYRPMVLRMIDGFGLIKLLRAIRDTNPSLADDLAQELWSSWQAGDEYGEWLSQWLTELGIDHAKVIEAEADRLARLAARRGRVAS